MLLPQNLEVERKVLGTLLNDTWGDEPLRYLDDITREDFADSDHADIFDAILDLVREGARPDPLLVHEKLPKGSDVTITTLAEMQMVACMPAQIPHCLKILHEKQRGRRLIRTIESAQVSLLQGEEYETVENYIVNSLSKQQAAEKTTSVVADDVDAILTGSDEKAGVPTGIEDIDTGLGGGIRQGEICLLAARTSVGKSALAVEVAANAIAIGIPLLYVSLEMPKKQIWRRTLAYWSRVSLRRFRDLDFNDLDAKRVRDADKELRPIAEKLYWVNTHANTPEELARLIRIEKLRHDIRFVVVDHAGRMRLDRGHRSDYEKMSEIANRLKDIAIQNDIPMLVLWQLNRSVEKDGRKSKIPTLADLRDSGQAEEVADIILLMYRDNYYDRSIPIAEAMVNINIAKGRDGCQLGDVEVPWLRLINRPDDDEIIPF